MANDWERLKALMKDLENEQKELRAYDDIVLAEMEQSRATIAWEQTKLADGEIEHAIMTSKLEDVERRMQAVVEPRKRALSLDEDYLASGTKFAGHASESDSQRARKHLARQDPVSGAPSAYEHRGYGGAVSTFRFESGRFSNSETRPSSGARLSQPSNSMSTDKDQRAADTSRAPDLNAAPPSTTTTQSRNRGGSSGPFHYRQPTEQDVWWSVSAIRWETASRTSRWRWTHVARAQELGMLRPGGACTRCIAKGIEAVTTCRVSGDRSGGECGRCIWQETEAKCE